MSTPFESLIAAELRCGDMARRWMTRCSNGNCYIIIEEFHKASDEALAEGCIRRWGLDQPQGDDNDISWFEQSGADRDMLIEAFATLRSFFVRKAQSPAPEE